MTGRIRLRPGSPVLAPRCDDQDAPLVAGIAAREAATSRPGHTSNVRDECWDGVAALARSGGGRAGGGGAGRVRAGGARVGGAAGGTAGGDWRRGPRTMAGRARAGLYDLPRPGARGRPGLPPPPRPRPLTA